MHTDLIRTVRISHTGLTVCDRKGICTSYIYDSRQIRIISPVQLTVHIDSDLRGIVIPSGYNIHGQHEDRQGCEYSNQNKVIYSDKFSYSVLFQDGILSDSLLNLQMQTKNRTMRMPKRNLFTFPEGTSQDTISQKIPKFHWYDLTNSKAETHDPLK